MRHAIIAVLAALLLAALAGTAVAGPFEDALSAHERGDYDEAVKLYRKAADQDDARAQFNLGFMYYNGQGVPQNHAPAMKWYRMAAEQGHVGALYYLGLMYAKGEGLPQNYVQAHMWFTLAGARGEKRGVKNRELIAQIMTPAEIAEAQKLAREWKPK